MSKNVTRSRSAIKRFALIACVVLVAAVFFQQGWHQLLTLEELKTRHLVLRDLAAANRVAAMLIFAGGYIVSAAAQLPGAAILTLAAGAMFGFWPGLILVSFSSTIGATVAMLLARYLLRDFIQARYGSKLESLDQGIAREGAFYLFTLRLIPVVPFWLINLGVGLTAMKTTTFAWVSQLGMLAGTAVYVFAGTQLATLEKLSDVASPPILAALILLGVFPLIARKVLALITTRRVYRGHSKPRKFDYNVVVIGAGSGGLVAAYIAAAVKAKVALIEANQMGGDCLNTGCVPSKALIRSAKVLHSAKRWGFNTAPAADVDFAAIMDRVHRVIAEIAPKDSVERYQSLGVDCISGTATVEDPWRVRVGERMITSRNLVIATGGEPFVPPIAGIDQVEFLTSDTLWNLRELPRRLVVLGGGPIGSEMTQAFARLGSKVTQVEMLPRLLSREDEDISRRIRERFEAEGIRVLTEHRATHFGVAQEEGASQPYLLCEHVVSGEQTRLEFDQVLIALGRRGRGAGLGLEQLGVEILPPGTIQHDQFMRTKVPNIFVCGDVAGPYQFTHTAAHQAWYAAVNALFSPIKKLKVDYRVVPWATFTDPEVARVGLNEVEARERGIAYEVTTYDLDDLDRAIADGTNDGVVKVLTVPGRDRILGVTIVGPHAGDLIAEFVLAMKHGLGLDKILATIHTYPTLAEANRSVAAHWKKGRIPARLLSVAERFHRWRRGGPSKRSSKGALMVAILSTLLATAELRAESSESDEFDQPFATVLDTHVSHDGQIDYPALAASPLNLELYAANLEDLDPAIFRGWSDDRKIAFWCNAYNALTLLAIVRNFPIEKGTVGLKYPPGIRWIPGVWSDPLFTVMGDRLSLEDIEHRRLRKNFDEPRIHMALVCAAKSCPPLRSEPYREVDLDRQLDQQTHAFLDSQVGLSIDRQRKTVHISKIFSWFGKDFVDKRRRATRFTARGLDKTDRAVLAFISSYLEQDDADYLRTAAFELSYLEYDWSLNQSEALPDGTASTQEPDPESD